jgi:signal transduction histidine kinase
MTTIQNDTITAAGGPGPRQEALLAELAVLRAENTTLRTSLQRSNGYIRDKVNQLLNVMGTKPLREEELDDDTIQDIDPLGIIFESFRHILATLKEKNSQLQLLHDETVGIFAAAQVGIMVVDRHFRILSSNNRMREIFDEVPALENCNELCRDLVCKGEIPDEFCAVRKILAGAERASFKGWEVRGHVFDVEAAPIHDADGTVKRMVLVYNDITGLKKAQNELGLLNAELEQRVVARTAQYQEVNRELESFCYSVSHDLRAPLRHISGFSNILQEDYRDRLDEEGQDYLRRICAVATKMGEMIDDLLRISRVSRAKMTFAEVDLSLLAENAANLFREAEPERSVRFEIEPGLIARGDATLLEMVLQNLIGNAWKYTTPRRDAVISFGRITCHGREIFFVRDNGVGFDMTYRDKLFRVFERLHGEEFEGSGIGLATVQRIINRHQGEIWAEGEVGMGATFYFTLPDADQVNQTETCSLLPPNGMRC